MMIRASTRATVISSLTLVFAAAPQRRRQSHDRKEPSGRSSGVVLKRKVITTKATSLRNAEGKNKKRIEYEEKQKNEKKKQTVVAAGLVPRTPHNTEFLICSMMMMMAPIQRGRLLTATRRRQRTEGIDAGVILGVTVLVADPKRKDEHHPRGHHLRNRTAILDHRSTYAPILQMIRMRHQQQYQHGPQQQNQDPDPQHHRGQDHPSVGTTIKVLLHILLRWRSISTSIGPIDPLSKPFFFKTNTRQHGATSFQEE